MEKKTIVITGTSSGIGLHLAKRFLYEGYSIVGLSRGNSLIVHDDYTHIICDITDNDSLHNAFFNIPKENIKGLICNAGIHGPISAFKDTLFAHWRNTFETNLFGHACLSQLLIPTLIEHKGFIIYMSGGGAGFAKPCFSAYSTSKTALVRFAENLAEELTPHVLVYSVAPGANDTELLKSAIAHGDVVTEEQRVLFKEPEDLCLFLAQNTDLRYSGRYIHVRDRYKEFGIEQFQHDMYKLRRTKKA